MTKKEKEQLDELMELRALNPHHKNTLLHFYRKYIDKNAVYCLNCDSSVRLLMKRLKTWWQSNKKHYTFIKSL